MAEKYLYSAGGVLQITTINDGEYLKRVGNNIVSAAIAASTNALLDGANHTDTVAAAVARGALIYGNSTPKWDKLALGAIAKALMSDGADALWRYPGLAILNVATASSSASVAFGLTSPANSDFIGYLVVFGNVAPATDGVNLILRTSTDGGATYDSGAGNYSWTSGRANETPALVAAGSASATGIQISASTLGNAANEMSSGIVLILNPSAANFCKVLFLLAETTTTTTSIATFGQGRRLAAADVDAIQFSMSSGNIASGEFRLYGIPAS